MGETTIPPTMSSPEYIVVCTHQGKTQEIVTFWYGPDHGFGTTSGDRERAATFPHRVAAEDALRSVFGSVAAAHRRGYLARSARYFPV